jgi:hypothetical protein
MESGKKRRVVIGIPGNNFTDKFLLSWTMTLVELLKDGKNDIIVSPGYSSFVSFARMKTLGLDVLRGHDQKPFNGLDYDVFLTIDSDMVYTPKHVLELLDATDEFPIVSGLYMMADNHHFAAVKKMDPEYFVKNGSYKFITQSELEKEPSHIPVEYTGMGFFACRREVLDAMTYPYFWHPLVEIQGEGGILYRDQMSEDVAFCKNAQTAGFPITLCTNIRVGHEKRIVL